MMVKTYLWYVWPQERLLWCVGDEFVTGYSRVKFGGNHIEIEVREVEGEDGQARARALAEQYIGALGGRLGIHCWLLTPDEFGALPAQIWEMRGPNREERRRVTTAVRAVRAGFVTDAPLMLCYGYLQEGRDGQWDGSDEAVLPNLYKAMEAIKKVFGGWKETDKALKVGAELEFIKKLANLPARDERHAPGPGEQVQRPTGEEIGRAEECARRVLRAYENHII